MVLVFLISSLSVKIKSSRHYETNARNIHCFIVNCENTYRTVSEMPQLRKSFLLSCYLHLITVTQELSNSWKFALFQHKYTFPAGWVFMSPWFTISFAHGVIKSYYENGRETLYFSITWKNGKYGIIKNLIIKY